MEINQQEKNFIRDGKILLLLCAFMALCFLSAMIMSVSIADKVEENLSGQGGLIGPIEIANDNTSVRIKIKRLEKYSRFDWDVLDVEVLDKDKNYIANFVAELWYESGRDWQEFRDKADMRYFFHYQGMYYLKINIESKYERNAADLFTLTVDQKVGSAELFKKIGFYMIWVCLAWFIWTMRVYLLMAEDSW